MREDRDNQGNNFWQPLEKNDEFGKDNKHLILIRMQVGPQQNNFV